MSETSVCRLPNSQWSPTYILPRIETDPAGPFRTMMSPERVCTSRSTAPLTWNVFSKCPCGVEAAAKLEANSTTNAIATNGDRDGIVETAIRQMCCLLMSVTPQGCLFPGGSWAPD